MIKYEQQWQRRVISEKKQLDIKRKKLYDFTSNPDNWNALSVQDKLLLSRQSVLMREYSIVLGKRLSYFKPTKATKPVREEPVKNLVVEG